MSQFRSSTTAILAGGAIALLAAGGGAAWWALHNLSQQSSRPIPVETPITPAPIPVQEKPLDNRPGTPAPVAQTTAEMYLLDPKSDRLILQAVTIKLAKTNDKQSILAETLNQLLASSATHPDQTTIPPNTKLLSLKVAADGIHLNLSGGFSNGGGSMSMVGRLGQVLYTATSLDRSAKVWISVNGQPLELLGGEGIEIPQPMTRKYFEENFQG